MLIRYRKEYFEGEGVHHPWKNSNIDEYYNNPLSDQFEKNDLGIEDFFDCVARMRQQV